MTIYYKNGGFYLKPQEDAVEISDELHIKLIEGQSQGKQIVERKDGLPMLAESQPSQYHEWNGEAWVISEAQLQALISAAKSAKLAEINDKAQGFVNDLAKLDSTPEFERETWGIQRDEARAWAADKTSDTPTLAVIAQMRGVPLDLLRQK